MSTLIQKKKLTSSNAAIKGIIPREKIERKEVVKESIFVSTPPVQMPSNLTITGTVDVNVTNSPLSVTLSGAASTARYNKCDGSTDTTTIQGTVQTVPHPDAVQKVQICPSGQENAMITCVQENTNLYIIDWDSDTNTFAIFDFNGIDVTGTVTPIKCEDVEITTTKDVVCDGIESLRQHSVYTDGTLDSVYYTTLIGTTPVTPAGVVTAGSCSANLSGDLLIKTDCTGTTSSVPFNDTYRVLIDQYLDTHECNSDAILVELEAINNNTSTDTDTVTTKSVVCNGGITIRQHTVYVDGVITSVYYTEEDGITPFTPVGPVSVGSCSDAVIAGSSLITTDCIGTTATESYTDTVRSIIDQELFVSECNSGQILSSLVDVNLALTDIENVLVDIELNTAVNANTYNTNTHAQVTSGTLNIPAATYNTVTISVASGSVDVTINGTTVNYPTGFSATFDATTLLTNAISIAWVSGQTIVLFKA